MANHLQHLTGMSADELEAALVSFGTYILSPERWLSMEATPTDTPVEDRGRQITDADISNWMEMYNKQHPR